MPRSICGGCHKIFSSTTAFDHHRLGDYGSPVYENERQRQNRKAALKFTHHTRRCMSTEEMRASGFAVERKTITIMREGQDFPEERDIWYEPDAREKLRQAYGTDDEDIAAE